jgi:hypothetical protein
MQEIRSFDPGQQVSNSLLYALEIRFGVLYVATLLIPEAHIIILGRGHAGYLFIVDSQDIRELRR